MKKLLILPAMLMVSFTYGQLSLGLKGGVNISNFTGGDFSTVEKSALIGFHAGGLMHFRFGNLILQPELLFSTQGATLEKAGVESDYKVSYVTIPVMLQYEMASGFYLEGGPQVGFKVSEDIPDMTIEDFAKGNDLSVGLGLGYHAKGGFGIGARYNVGISKVGDFSSSNIDPDFQNAVIQVGIFYTFFNKCSK